MKYLNIIIIKCHYYSLVERILLELLKGKRLILKMKVLAHFNIRMLIKKKIKGYHLQNNKKFLVFKIILLL